MLFLNFLLLFVYFISFTMSLKLCIVLYVSFTTLDIPFIFIFSVTICPCNILYEVYSNSYYLVLMLRFSKLPIIVCILYFFYCELKIIHCIVCIIYKPCYSFYFSFFCHSIQIGSVLLCMMHIVAPIT